MASKITFTVQRFIAQIDITCRTARINHYRYGDSHSIRPGDDHVLSCDRMIFRTLYDLGMTDQQKGGQTVLNMDSWLTSHGFQKITNQSQIKRGDIILFKQDGSSTFNAAWHTFVVTSYNHATRTCGKYDFGSQTRIQTVQPYVNVPFDEWGNKSFYAAYRIPGNGSTPYLSQETIEFNYKLYGGLWADLLKTFGWNKTKLLNHFNSFGMKEGRRASVVFDPKYYKNNYKDLQKTFGNNWKNYFDHFYNYGMKEGRRASQIFDPKFYKNKYADLRKAFGNDWHRYYDHFVKSGMQQGRQGSAEFNPKTYKKRYADLAKAYGNNWEQYYRHYVVFGKKEKRKGI